VAAFVSFESVADVKLRTFVFLAGFRKQPFSDFCLFASKDIASSETDLPSFSGEAKLLSV
jgi:hypothetical protein